MNTVSTKAVIKILTAQYFVQLRIDYGDRFTFTLTGYDFVFVTGPDLDRPDWWYVLTLTDDPLGHKFLPLGGTESHNPVAADFLGLSAIGTASQVYITASYMAEHPDQLCRL